MNVMRLKIYFVVLVLIIMSISLAGCDSREKIVVYNWGEYIAEDTVALFEEAYPQYRVVYRTFDDNEKMYPKIGKESFDVIIPSDYMIIRLIKEGKLQKLNNSDLPNVSEYMNTKLMDISFDQDPAVSSEIFEYAVPYLYCTVGLIYNTELITLEDEKDPKEVWGILFDNQYKNKIGMYDSMRESIGATLNYLGYSVNTTDSDELDEAKALLINQRINIEPVMGIDTLKDKYVSEELVAGVAWSGDYQVCLDVLEESGKDTSMLGFALPEGSNFAVDMMAVPANAKNVTGAHLFINYMYETNIALENALYAGYSSPHVEAVELLPEEIRNNPNFYPDEKTMETLEVYFSSETIDTLYDDIWEQVMAN